MGASRFTNCIAVGTRWFASRIRVIIKARGILHSITRVHVLNVKRTIIRSSPYTTVTKFIPCLASPGADTFISAYRSCAFAVIITFQISAFAGTGVGASDTCIDQNKTDA